MCRQPPLAHLDARRFIPCGRCLPHLGAARLHEARGARFTLLCGYGISYWKVGLGYALVGIGVGFAGTPASHSLTGSVPVERAGTASGTADLQRDLGGAIMQSIMGALLTAGYAAAAGAAIVASNKHISDSVENELTKSFVGAQAIAQQHPNYASQTTAAAKTSFLQGDQWAYIAGIVAILLGAVIVFFPLPKKEEEEQQLLVQYQAEDAKASPAAPSTR